MRRPDTRSRLNDLADVALRALPAMYDERSGLFAHKTLLDGGGYLNREPNVLYSTVSLVGILRQRRTPPDAVVPIGRALDALHTAVALRPEAGALGNLLWACALADDRRAGSVVSTLAEGVSRGTLGFDGLGNALHGLVAAAERFPSLRDEALPAAELCARELLGCFSPSVNLFRAAHAGLRPRRATLEAALTSFAGQVYPLHGLTAYYRFTGQRPPDVLARVADTVVGAQGPLGQWWWLYSSRTGRVVEGYPVYSVHQDGMAFVALAPLRDLGLPPYDDALALGLNWLYGDNELGVDLVERAPAFIHRCIQRAGSDADGPYGLSKRDYAGVVARSLRPAAGDDRTAVAPERLEVLRECRSYHLGWILCAHALTEAAATRSGS